MSPDIQAKFESYPPHVKQKMLALRSLILAVAKTLGKRVDESLKWGQLSYAVKGGTPIRIDWSPQSPSSLSVYVNCKTTLVDTFREVQPDAFEYRGNRQLQFGLDKHPPEEALRLCISVAFTYHSRKTAPLLGL
ncbi:DUF1801 domain-containing protein [Enterovibrio sp. 27052020O]|uniref:DUF1801 domain-containing protein n=1 Tax=Enterovibrio sp. 27052020O TaxID=3241166 RepID=UPI00388F8A13